MTDELGWFVLLHTPGPAVGEAGVFAHPGFADHVGFLRRRIEDGSLVAAGPLGDGTTGEGMTVLRAPSLADARRLAEKDDASVVAGVLTVQVRPWQVRMAPAYD